MSIPFTQLGLSSALVESAASSGYQNPTPIQVQAIPVLLSGQNLIGQAQTGTGKTAAYGMPLLDRVRPGGPIQALVLVPTRELAIQVCENLQQWSSSLRSLACYGGQPIPEQFRVLRHGVQIVVATPGRLIDHLERGSISLQDVHFCVLDEADEMLDFGFEEELQQILEKLPQGCQLALFSATFPAKIKQLAGRHMAQACRIEIEASQRTVETIEQYYSLVRPGLKGRALGRLLDHQDPGPSLIFCRTRSETQQLTEELRRRSYAAECLNGEMDQSERERVMERFRLNQCKILVATDIAARGLDIEGITHVFNYDIPWDLDQYIHRVGRTARAGRTGIAITLIEPNQLRHLQRIERESGAKFKPYEVPSMDQIAVGRKKRFAQRVRQQIEDPASQEQLSLVHSLCTKYEPAVVAAAALQALWDTSYGALAQDDGMDLSPAAKSFGWLRLNLGRRDGMNVAQLLRTLQDQGGIGRVQFGRILIEDTSSLVEAPSGDLDRLILALRRVRLAGKRLRVDVPSEPVPMGRPAKSSGKPPFKASEGPMQQSGKQAGKNKRTWVDVPREPVPMGRPAKSSGKPPFKASEKPMQQSSKQASKDKRTWVGQPDKPKRVKNKTK